MVMVWFRTVLQYLSGVLRKHRVGLRPLACWDRGFESHLGHGCLSVVSVVCSQIEVSAMGLITRPEESYRLWCVVVCDQETSLMRRPWPALGRSATRKKNLIVIAMYLYCYICSALYILFSSCQLALFGYPDRGFFYVFSSVVRQMPGYNSQRRGTARTIPN